MIETSEKEKLCCKWQNLIWECLRQQNFQEFYECFEGWSKSGKINPDGSKVEWDCYDCNKTYSVLGAGGNLKDFDIDKFKMVGCCRTIPMIRNLDDKVEVERLGFWLICFKDVMCSDCNEIARQGAIETGWMKTIVKMMNEERKKEQEEWFANWIKNNEPKVILGEMLYCSWKEQHDFKNNPYWQLELWDEMKQQGKNWWNPSRREITDYFFDKEFGKTKWSDAELKEMIVKQLK